MKDSSFVHDTLTKIEGALRMHRSEEIRIVIEALESKGISLTRNDNYNIQIYRADADGRKTGKSFLLTGYKRQTQQLLQRNEELLQGDISPEAEKAFNVLVKDDLMIKATDLFMIANDMVVVKRVLPEIKPFMALVEKERKEAWENKFAKWRKAYETCIELFGDDARG